MTGRELYERWLARPPSADTERYYDALHPIDRNHWDSLASDLTADLQAARNDGVIECSEAMQDAWERREARRCPSTT